MDNKADKRKGTISVNEAVPFSVSNPLQNLTEPSPPESPTVGISQLAWQEAWRIHKETGKSLREIASALMLAGVQVYKNNKKSARAAS